MDLSASCPQCGHPYETDELPTTSPDLAIVCPRCQAHVQQPDGLGCAEWDQYCQEIPLPAEV